MERRSQNVDIRHKNGMSKTETMNIWKPKTYIMHGIYHVFEQRHFFAGAQRCFVLFTCECMCVCECVFCARLYSLRSNAAMWAALPCFNDTILFHIVWPLMLLLLLLLLRQIKAPISIRTDVSSMKNVDRITSERLNFFGLQSLRTLLVVVIVVDVVFQFLLILFWFPLELTGHYWLTIST